MSDMYSFDIPWDLDVRLLTGTDPLRIDRALNLSTVRWRRDVRFARGPSITESSIRRIQSLQCPSYLRTNTKVS